MPTVPVVSVRKAERAHMNWSTRLPEEKFSAMGTQFCVTPTKLWTGLIMVDGVDADRREKLGE